MNRIFIRYILLIRCHIQRKQSGPCLLQPISHRLFHGHSLALSPRRFNRSLVELGTDEGKVAVYTSLLDGRSSILNTARMSFFSSDRAVRDYAREIWKVPAG